MPQVHTLTVSATCSSCGRWTNQRWLILARGDAAAVECEVCRQLLVVEEGLVVFPFELSGRRVSGDALTAVTAAIPDADDVQAILVPQQVIELARVDRQAVEERLGELRSQIADEARRLTEIEAFIEAYRSYEERLPGAANADQGL